MSVTSLFPRFKFTFSISNQSQISSSSSSSSSTIFHNSRFIKKPQSFCSLNTKLSSAYQIITRGVSSGSFDDPPTSQVSDFEASRSSISGDEYVGLFIRKLGFDNDPLDREQAVDALWKYSLGGKKCIDEIMKSRGLVSLTVNLLNSKSSGSCEAAAGLLGMISSVNIYRDFVAESGAIQGITGLLRRSSLTPEVKEQSLRVLSNLSVDETLQDQIANSDLLPLLIKFLDDEDMKVIEAAGGVLANLPLRYHSWAVVNGVIPPLAKFLSTNSEGSKVIRKIAQRVFLELAQCEYNTYKMSLLNEDLVVVPLVGAAAYKALKPSLHSLPSLPDGSELNVKQSLNGESELLLNLQVEDDKKTNLEEAKKNAIAGRTQQQFLARTGAIETEDESIEIENQKFTILPCVDAVARLVLILELEDELAIAKSAEAIADISCTEHMMTSLKEAGAVENLFRLIDHPSVSVRVGVIRALERLSASDDVRQRILAEGVLNPLIGSLKNRDDLGSVTDEILVILARILDPIEEMKSKFNEDTVNGSGKGRNEARTPFSNMTLSFETIQEGDLSDSEFLSCLIGILRTSSPFLQEKAASILEFLTTFETCREKIISLDIESALDSLFKYKFFDEKEDMDVDSDCDDIELKFFDDYMTFHAISAASQLLTRLLDSEHFKKTVNLSRLTDTLRKILASKLLLELTEWNTPLQTKQLVAACLVKLDSFSGPAKLGPENPINTDVMLYETIPRLIEKIQDSFSPESREAAVLELKRIVCEGVVDYTLAAARKGCIFPLVKAIEDGNNKVVAAGLDILYNLSMDTENHAAIVAAGALPILRKIVLSEGWEFVRALRLLRTLPV